MDHPRCKSDGQWHLRRARHALLGIAILPALSGCATFGSLMTPYSENFSCKNDDHGQCIDPHRAYADAIAGLAPRSNPAVTSDRKLLGQATSGMTPDGTSRHHTSKKNVQPPAYEGYRASVYRELQGLVDEPVTPMLKSPRTVRTLILPYADRQRPDRLYMPRFVYSILDAPAWVIGGAPLAPLPAVDKAPVLGQVRERASDAPASTTPVAASEESRP